MITARADEDPSKPVSPFSYFFPLFLVVLVCGGYVFWRRAQRRSESGIPLSFARGSPTVIRLSEDGPPTHSFISNNASTDSLPSHALNDVPMLPNQYQHPAKTSPSPSPLPQSVSYANHNHNHSQNANSGLALGGRYGRRSTKGPRAPIEADEGSSEDSEGEVDGQFKIGEGDDDASDDELGPLSNR